MSAALHAGHIPFASSGSYPVRAGNRVRPLVDGEPAFRRICEAIEAATRSVWVTVAFLSDGFEMPDGRGDVFAVLDRAAARGLDVRVIFWRNNDGSGFAHETVFSGHAEHRSLLKDRGSRFLARWDRAQRAYCQHQKSWLIDAGRPSEVAFVGGINLNKESCVAPGHQGREHGHTHDVYVEIAGPCATDAHHNFVQRWNEASERETDDGAWPSRQHANDLQFPASASPEVGRVTAQVQRTVRAGHYRDGTATPGGSAFTIEAGETTLFEQYQKAIAAARSTIYLENQALGQAEIVEALHAALDRGVAVTVLTPADANELMKLARKEPRSRAFYERFEALGKYDHFALIGIASPDPRGKLRNIYVHAKTALIDDAWATIGSCNLGSRSFFGDTEMNVTFWAPDVVKPLRCDLLSEHLGVDTSRLDDRAAFALYREHARANAERRVRGEALKGLAFTMDPTRYAM